MLGTAPISEIIWCFDLQIYELREDIPNPFYQPPTARKEGAPQAEGAADAAVETAPMETSESKGSEEKGSADSENSAKSNGQNATAS